MARLRVQIVLASDNFKQHQTAFHQLQQPLPVANPTRIFCSQDNPRLFQRCGRDTVSDWCIQGHCVFDKSCRVFRPKCPAKGRGMLGFAGAPGRLTHGDERHHLLAMFSFDLCRFVAISYLLNTGRRLFASNHSTTTSQYYWIGILKQKKRGSEGRRGDNDKRPAQR